MFSRRAFINHYIMSNTEELELQLAREDLNTLSGFYDEIKAEGSYAQAKNRVSCFIPPNATE